MMSELKAQQDIVGKNDEQKRQNAYIVIPHYFWTEG